MDGHWMTHDPSDDGDDEALACYANHKFANGDDNGFDGHDKLGDHGHVVFFNNGHCRSGNLTEAQNVIFIPSPKSTHLLNPFACARSGKDDNKDANNNM